MIFVFFPENMLTVLLKAALKNGSVAIKQPVQCNIAFLPERGTVWSSPLALSCVATNLNVENDAVSGRYHEEISALSFSGISYVCRKNRWMCQ